MVMNLSLNAKQLCFTLSEVPSDVIISPRPEGVLLCAFKTHFFIFVRRVKHSWRHDIFSLQAV